MQMSLSSLEPAINVNKPQTTTTTSTTTLWLLQLTVIKSSVQSNQRHRTKYTLYMNVEA